MRPTEEPNAIARRFPTGVCFVRRISNVVHQQVGIGRPGLLKHVPVLLLALASVVLLATPCQSFGRFHRPPRCKVADSEPKPFLKIHLHMKSPPKLADEETVTVVVDGLPTPTKYDWMGMMMVGANLSVCPLYRAVYEETGDQSDLPLLCTYPIKTHFLSDDPDYMTCKNSRCILRDDEYGDCLDVVCKANLTFHVVNIRTDIQFVLFTYGFDNPCVITQTEVISFKNQLKPLYPHLSTNDSSATTMRLTWISNTTSTEYIKYGAGKYTTDVPDDGLEWWDMVSMCGGISLNYGFHEPGLVHTALMTGLQPSHTYTYSMGSDSVGWSGPFSFKTPPAGGSNEAVCFLVVADMGRASLDNSEEHYTRPAASKVINAMAEEVKSGQVDLVFHLGGLSYATGFAVGWDYFLKAIEPVASRVPYMTAIGDHERDYPANITIDGSQLESTMYNTTESGGECGIPYAGYFQMPNQGFDKPWYSIEQGNVHFTIISTEHDWTYFSEQYAWFKDDMETVDRSRTPWLIIMGHRPMYSSVKNDSRVDYGFGLSFENHLIDNKVDLAIFGHIYNYERTCAVSNLNCKANPTKDEFGIDVYNNTNAPIHLVIGTGGFSLEEFTENPKPWSLVRIAKYGYLKLNATGTYLDVQFIDATTGAIADGFVVIKT